MICDECQQRPVTVHLTRIANNRKTELHLCEDCAKKYQKQFSAGFDHNFSIHKFLAGLLDEELTESPALEPVVKCSMCGLTYGDFSKHGRLGCGRCYDTFRNKIDPLLERIHGSSVHSGKVAGSKSRQDAGNEKESGRIQEIERLRGELQSLVVQELFEEAAEVRDRIKELESSTGSTS